MLAMNVLILILFLWLHCHVAVKKIELGKSNQEDSPFTDQNKW